MPLPMHQPGQGSPKYVIAVAAGKGGVGKSSVTVNLALALQKAGYKVGIMDTDIYGPSVRRMLPEERLPTQQGPTIFPALCHGLSVISLAYFRKENEAAVIRAPIATSIVTQFIEQVQWGPLDFLLIDFPPGTGDVQLTLSQRAKLTGAVMVTTPQEVAVMDVRKAIDMFHQVQVPILGIVENMSYYYHAKTQERLCLFGSGGGERLADEVGAPFLGKIPLDPAVSKNGDEGLSLFDGSEDTGGAAKAFQELAAQVVAHAHVLKNSVSDGISKIEQKDPQTITIVWNDGQQRDYRLSDLQRQCPCAACVDEFTGKRTADPSQVKDDVGAVRISSVGRYALKFQFTSGCSTGIYGFDLLRTQGEPTR